MLSNANQKPAVEPIWKNEFPSTVSKIFGRKVVSKIKIKINIKFHAIKKDREIRAGLKPNSFLKYPISERGNPYIKGRITELRYQVPIMYPIANKRRLINKFILFTFMFFNKILQVL